MRSGAKLNGLNPSMNKWYFPLIDRSIFISYLGIRLNMLDYANKWFMDKDSFHKFNLEDQLMIDVEVDDED